MPVLVTYDVSTTEGDGARRLRRVAKGLSGNNRFVYVAFFDGAIV
jgi:CRISPR/Cas system-associated endoribonuclease Cas2